jgi:hypothetical protein
LTGLLALIVGVVLVAEVPEPKVRDGALLTVKIGGGVAAVGLLFELLFARALLGSRRGAVGSNVMLQVLLAAGLLALVNVYSFNHYLRFDWTRDRQFTIKPELRDQLSKLRGETKIVVFLKHRSFGQTGDQDNYDAAAERKIVEKVKDLTEQFQELGPRFRVEVLDIQQEDYAEKLADYKKTAPELASAIEAAPEDTIFFHAGDKVQRLAFHDVYQLDKAASKKANDGNGNLVLHYQGAEPIANRILNIEEKKPRVLVGVIHEFLGMDNKHERAKTYGMYSAKLDLVGHGFQTRDVILKRLALPPEAIVLTRDENRYDNLDAQIKRLDRTIAAQEKQLDEGSKEFKLWKNGTLAEINKEYAVGVVGGQGRLMERKAVPEFRKQLGNRLKIEDIAEDNRKMVLEDLEPRVTIMDLRLTKMRGERDQLTGEQKGLNVDNYAEQQRITDLRAKFNRLLSDCDLLIVPRMTLSDVNERRSGNLPNSYHPLDKEQLSAIKDFMKKGKPVLFCIGPPNEAPDSEPPLSPPDELEDMLADLGFKLPKQTILYDAEAKTFGERRGGLLILDTSDDVKLPPVTFNWPLGTGRKGRIAENPPRPENPIRQSMRLFGAGDDTDTKTQLVLRHPRPVYFAPKGDKPATDPIFMMTSAATWNDDQPFPTGERVPHLEKPKPGDPTIGTPEEKGEGPFPIGAAAEVEVPASWAGAKGQKVRVAVIGHGGIFSGTELTPVHEKLLLDVSNWLVGRDDLLAKDKETWQYPRAHLPEWQDNLWRWGTRLGMPLLFVYLGLVVLMVRHMR